jgi:hypothetical protein
MCFASCAQDLGSRKDISADPILAADAGITPSGLVGACVTDFGSVGLVVVRENRAPNPSLERLRKAVRP